MKIDAHRLHQLLSDKKDVIYTVWAKKKEYICLYAILITYAPLYRMQLCNILTDCI